YSVLFFFYCSAAPRDLHSFPTRRSSDLGCLSVSASWRVGGAGGCSAIRIRVISAASVHIAGVCLSSPNNHSAPSPDRGVCRSARDRKSTRLNSSHLVISYAVFCLKKKKI